jgi:hypothetical protein
MLPEDRAFLVRVVTGIAAPEAERRVDEVAARSRENIARARRTAVVMAFAAGASALLGLAAAWLAERAGGQVRDGAVAPSRTRRAPAAAPAKLASWAALGSTHDGPWCPSRVRGIRTMNRHRHDEGARHRTIDGAAIR